MSHPSLDFLRGEADTLELEAARIRAALRSGQGPEAAAKACLSRAADHIGPMLSEEELTISAVMLEHAGNEPDCPAEAEKAARNDLRRDYERLQADLDAGKDCRPTLNACARDLDELARFERNSVAPFCERHLSEPALREADHRIQCYGDTFPMDGTDLDHMMAA